MAESIFGIKKFSRKTEYQQISSNDQNSSKSQIIKPSISSFSETKVANTKARSDARKELFNGTIQTAPLDSLHQMSIEDARVQLSEVLRVLLSRNSYNLDVAEQDSVLEEIINDIVGLGPLESLLSRDDISDIMVCGPYKIFIEINGKLQLAEEKFRDEQQLRYIASRIVQAVGRRVDESSPICDARLKDGSRVAVVIPPIAIDGTCMTIRKFKKDKLTLDDLVRFGSITKEGAKLLEIISACRLNILISGGTGSGKAQSLDSLLRTPTGWKKMGDAVVNDILMAPDGTTTRITGVFPQGEKEVFKITFEDERTVESSDDHLWKVWTRNSEWNPIKKKKERNIGWKVIPLSKIRNLRKTKQSMWKKIAIPLVSPMAMEFPTMNLPIDPYTLGILLGNGNIKNNTAIISNIDEKILQAFADAMPEYKLNLFDDIYDSEVIVSNHTKKSSLRNSLNNLGLWKKSSYDKFIPQEYKNGSILQRLDIIQGLLDTDGLVDKTNAIVKTVSQKMAYDIQEICWSLGAIAVISERKLDFTCKEEKRKGRLYRINIRHPDLASLFSTPNKVSKISDKKTSLRLGIKSIESIGIKPVQCISVDHPESLYVTDNYVVTHNTTLLNCLTRFIDPEESIITCEDAAELQLQQPNVRRWETKTANLEGVGEIPMSQLVKASLRHRPERIIIGEVRGPEAFDLLQAMNTGHDGSMGTVHSNSPREAVSRMENLIAMGGFNLSPLTVREQIVGSINIIVQASRLRDGSRKITHVSELTGMEGDKPQIQDLMKIEQRGEGVDGKLDVQHVMTGIRPSFWEKACYYGREKELASIMENQRHKK